jgi:glyoxylase-like metal-dependent hydrolase (beta-lactamase superfamily II)
MITELFPSLYLLRPAQPAPKTQFTYLLRRREGNILFATKYVALAHAADLDALGGVRHILLGDRHHATAKTVALAQHFDTVLTASDIEAKALATAGVAVGRRLAFERQAFAPDLEILPTPGHTRGAFSYLWTRGRRRFLFIGDTLVPIGGSWEYWVVKPNRAQMQNTVAALAAVDFDTILSNSFAAEPTAWLDVDAASRAQMFAELGARLKRS